MSLSRLHPSTPAAEASQDAPHLCTIECRPIPTLPCGRPILDARTPAWVARNVSRTGPIVARKELTR